MKEREKNHTSFLTGWLLKIMEGDCQETLIALWLFKGSDDTVGMLTGAVA